MSKGKRPENLKEKAARGAYELIEPLDYLILEALPDEGELVMNFYPMVTTANQLSKEVFKNNLTPLQIGSDLRRLIVQDLVVKVKGRSEGTGFQRTRKGKELLENWKKRNGGTK